MRAAELPLRCFASPSPRGERPALEVTSGFLETQAPVSSLVVEQKPVRRISCCLN